MTRHSVPIAPKISFGTDGWRGVMGEQVTEASMARVANAYARFLLAECGPTASVTIGYDHRANSDRFARIVAAVMQCKGVDVQLFARPVPTPLVSFSVWYQKRSGGVVITASHNPPEYNGFKIKEAWGGSAFTETTRQVEQLIEAVPPSAGEMLTFSSPPDNVRQAYFDRLAEIVDLQAIKSSGMTAVIDSMHGTGGTVIADLLSAGYSGISIIRDQPDVTFGGTAPEPIAKNFAALCKSVAERQAQVGIALDGDADRLGAVDENGTNITMQELAPLLLQYLIEAKAMRGAVVGTVTQSVLLKRVADAYGLPFIETPVGFKYIAGEMLSKDVLIGAEESGGIGIKGHIPERDGILNALLLLEMLAVRRVSASASVRKLKDKFGEFFYDRIDLRRPVDEANRFVQKISQHPPSSLCSKVVVEAVTVDGVKLILAGGSWIMFRASGTEPLLRVYAEATSLQLVQQLLSAGEQLVGG